MRPRLLLSLVPALALFAACGDDAPNEFDTTTSSNDSSGTGTETGTPSDMPMETGGQEAEGDGDGDGGVGVCGDGSVDVGEQCDSDDLNGFTCVDLGYSGGELACDPVTCTYDASACVTDGDGGDGGTTG